MNALEQLEELRKVRQTALENVKNAKAALEVAEKHVTQCDKLIQDVLKEIILLKK